MASRDLRTLSAGFRPKVVAFKASALDRGIEILIYCTKRSDEEQARLWRQGRSGRLISEMHKFLTYRAEGMIDGANDCRLTALEVLKARACFVSGGLSRRRTPDTERERVAAFLAWQSETIESVGPQHEDRVVTNAKPGDGPHNYGMAFDCVPVRDGALAWNHDPSWDTLGEIAVTHEIEWSGTWTRFIERVHFQETDWRERAGGTMAEMEGGGDGVQ
jgi:peptidoglycan L-alanyl-D-glutamate endopeptidase CwlK